MFGDNDYEEWADFLQEYSPPPYSLPGHTPALSFGVAGPGSGVPFHTHGYNTILLLLTVLTTLNHYVHRPGFAETIYGRKRWFLTAPDVQPDFHPNKTTLQWLLEDYKAVKAKVMIGTQHNYLLDTFTSSLSRSPCWSARSGRARLSTSRTGGGTPRSTSIPRSSSPPSSAPDWSRDITPEL